MHIFKFYTHICKFYNANKIYHLVTRRILKDVNVKYKLCTGFRDFYFDFFADEKRKRECIMKDNLRSSFTIVNSNE